MWLRSNYLLFTEILHLSVALLVILWFWQRFPKANKFYSLFVGLMFGFFVDGDHMLEYVYYLMRNGKPFYLWGFFSSDYFKDNNMIVVLGHAWEYVAILVSVYWFNRKNNLLWPKYALLAGLALGGHICVDQVTNMSSPWFYFITYRLLNGFSLGI